MIIKNYTDSKKKNTLSFYKENVEDNYKPSGEMLLETQDSEIYPLLGTGIK